MAESLCAWEAVNRTLYGHMLCVGPITFERGHDDYLSDRAETALAW